MASVSQEAEEKEPIDFKHLHNLELGGERVTIEWCMEIGVLSNTFQCSKCGRDMKLYERREVSDTCQWRCIDRYGDNKHDFRRSVRRGSFFEGTRLGLSKILQIIYMWVMKASIQMTMDFVRLGSRSTVNDWFRNCQEICLLKCVQELQDCKIGGAGMIVELGEGRFEKRKYNSRVQKVGSWMFVGHERENGKCFYRIVEDRSKMSLLSVITESVLPRSTIVADSWKLYDCLSEEDLKTLRTSYTFKFKDPETDAETKILEGTWNSLKLELCEPCDVNNPLDFQLAEYCWRKVFSNDKVNLFLSFLEAVKEIYPPPNKEEDLLMNQSFKRKLNE